MSDMQANQVVQESPLVHLQMQASRDTDEQVTGISVRECPFIGDLQLNAEPDDPRFLIAVGEVMSVERPLAVSRISCLGRIAILWLAHDSWLVLTPPGEPAPVEQVLAEVFGQDIQLSTSASGDVRAMLSEAAIEYILASQNTSDFHSDVDSQRQLSRTQLREAGVCLFALSDMEGYDIIVRRSGAEYLQRWLQASHNH